MNKSKKLLLIGVILVVVGLFVIFQYVVQSDRTLEDVEVIDFNGERALKDVQYQVDLGPRVSGSLAHDQEVEWIEKELKRFHWQVQLQETTFQGKPIKNVIASRGSGEDWIILGAHYDSRILADRDPDPTKRGLPVPGANDGASGVAVLLELARSLPPDLNKTIWLVFFDAEDNGRIGDWDWILGSRAFVQNLTGKPNAAVILDMIGDKDLELYWEMNSDRLLSEQIWAQAKDLGYNQFIPQPKHRILDDHVPFIEAGIPAVDLIDIEYAYYHTTQDTSDKVSAESLQAVGDTLLHWLIQP